MSFLSIKQIFRELFLMPCHPMCDPASSTTISNVVPELSENKLFDLNSFDNEGTKQSILSLLLKFPSISLYKRGMTIGSPLWKRGGRGDFVKNFDSIGVVK